MRNASQPGDDQREQHDAETRLYEPLHQSAPPEPADLVVAPQPAYSANFNIAPEHRRSPQERAVAAARLNAVLRWFFGLIEALVIIRFILKAVAASGAAPFASLIYGITGPLVAPFVGVLPAPALGASVFELPALLAIAIYVLVAFLITRLIRILFIDQPPLR